MVYFLGRDVDVYVFVEASATSANAAIGSSGSEVCNGAATLDATFAQSMASGGSLSAVLADFTAESDITGVDIGIGATDEHASAPITTPVTVPDLLRTILTLMGVDTEKMHYDQLGRPHPVVSGGELIKEVM